MSNPRLTTAPQRTPTNPLTSSRVGDEGTGDKGDRVGAVVGASEAVMGAHRIIRFHERALIEITSTPYKGAPPFTHFTPLHKDHFESLAYPILGGLSRSRLSDVFSYVINMAPDLSYNDHLIAFGPLVWDTKALDFDFGVSPTDVVWRSSVPTSTDPGHSEFVMQLAGGDEDVYADMLQSMAPIVSYQKPDGAIWWVGSGANGKSSLMDALYRIFPNQLASLTVKNLTDERDTPMLNGHLANIVKESSEGRIDDTQIYKSVGTHEDFRVHKFHSQDSVVINGNLHHIFSANSIPSFNDKGYSARRRTHIIPFNQVFYSDPEFNNRTFTQPNLSLIASEMLRYAIKLRDQGHLYKFSKITTEAKVEYDAEANNAEEFARELITGGVVGFDTFEEVKAEYDVWCAQNGYVPLGIANMRKAIHALGFERISYRTTTGASAKRYRLPTVDPQHMMPYGMGRPGMFTAMGFTPNQSDTPPAPVQQPLGSEW